MNLCDDGASWARSASDLPLDHTPLLLWCRVEAPSHTRSTVKLYDRRGAIKHKNTAVYSVPWDSTFKHYFTHLNLQFRG